MCVLIMMEKALGITISDNHKCFFQSAFFIFLFYFIVSVVLVDLFDGDKTMESLITLQRTLLTWLDPV